MYTCVTYSRIFVLSDQFDLALVARTWFNCYVGGACGVVRCWWWVYVCVCVCACVCINVRVYAGMCGGSLLWV